MASITLTFTNPVQDSVQVGDIAYYTSTSAVGGFTTGGSIIEMGSITAVGTYSITCNISDSTPRPSGTDFILFSKDNRVNMASITGYFAEVEMINNSNIESEIFHLSSETVISSK
jgi:hypothetical protein